jgi:hypothetical protein
MELWTSRLLKQIIQFKYSQPPNFTYGKFNPSYKKVFEIYSPILHMAQPAPRGMQIWELTVICFPFTVNLLQLTCLIKHIG